MPKLIPKFVLFKFRERWQEISVRIKDVVHKFYKNVDTGNILDRGQYARARGADEWRARLAKVARATDTFDFKEAKAKLRVFDEAYDKWREGRTQELGRDFDLGDMETATDLLKLMRDPEWEARVREAGFGQRTLF